MARLDMPNMFREGVRWLLVLVVFVLVYQYHAASKAPAADWFNVWRQLNVNGGREAAEVVADQIAETWPNEEEFAFYYNRYFLEDYVAKELSTDALVHFNNRRMEYIHNLSNPSQSFVTMNQFESDLLLESLQFTLESEKKDERAQFTYEEYLNLSLAHRAMEEVSDEEAWPWARQLTFAEAAKMLHMQLFAHDLRHELLNLEFFTDVRVLLGWPKDAAPAISWPAGLGENPFPFERGNHIFRVSQDLKSSVYDDSFTSGIEQLLKIVDGSPPTPISLAVTAQNMDAETSIWMLHGFAREGNLHIVKVSPEPAQWMGALAYAREGASVTDEQTTGTADLVTKFEGLLEQFSGENKRVLQRKLERLKNRPNRKRLAEAFLRHFDPVAEVEVDARHLEFVRYRIRQASHEAAIEDEFKEFLSVTKNRKPDFSVRQLLDLMNEISYEVSRR